MKKKNIRYSELFKVSKITFDGDVNAGYIYLKSSKTGPVVIDFGFKDRYGEEHAVGIEILNYSKFVNQLKELTEGAEA